MSYFQFSICLVLLGFDLSLAFGKESEEGEEQTEQNKEEQAERNFVVTVEESLPLVAKESVVATKLLMLLQEIPASVSVVTHSLFKSQDAVILGDALRNVSGINVQTGFGVHDLFVARGFDSLSSGLVLIDGAAEPEATFYNLYNVDRVEVLKGPAAFLYGGNPLSAAVNLVRKQPQFHRFFQTTGTVGSFGTFRGQFDLNLAEDDSPLAFRLNVMGEDSSGYRDGRDHYQVAVNPALTWKMGSDTAISFNLEYVNNRYIPDAGLPLVGDRIAQVPRRRSYASPFDQSDQDFYRARLDWVTRLTNSVTLRDKFYYTDLNWASAGTLLNGVFPTPAGDLQVQRVLSLLDDRQRLMGNQFEVLFTLDTGPIRHELLTGLEASRLGDDFRLDVAALPGTDLFNPQETAEMPLFKIPGQSLAGDSRSLIVAPYFLDRLAIGEKVKLFAGGRFDLVDFEDEITSTYRNETQFNPMVGLLVAPDSTLSLYTNGGTAFSPPSTLVIGDRNPEETIQVEVGAKKTFLGGKLQANLALYHLEKENIAIPDNSGVTRQIGNQRARGFEFELFAEHTPFWHSFLAYAYNRTQLTNFTERAVINFNPFTLGTVDRSGNRAAFTPVNIFNFWTNKEFWGGIGVGGGTRYVSKQFIASDNAFTIDGYLLLDAVISYRINNWRLSLNLKNLTNQDYETRGFGANSVIPGNSVGIFMVVQFTR